MYVANKNINTLIRTFHKGEIVPTEYVSDHMKLTGAVLFREDPQPKAKAPRKLEQIKSEPLKPHTDDKKVEILTEDSSKVEIVKESL